MGEQEVEAVVDALLDAIQRGDVEGVKAIYADDAAIWHNYDMVTQTREENLKVMAWMARTMRDLRYTEIRRVHFDGGLVQQHVLTGTAPSGASLRMPAMLRIEVRDGHVARIEEYLDPSQVAALSDRSR